MVLLLSCYLWRILYHTFLHLLLLFCLLSVTCTIFSYFKVNMVYLISIYIKLGRSRDGKAYALFVMVFVRSLRSSLHSVRFGQLLCCAHKYILNRIKVYIERSNIQVELIRFRKKYHLYSRLLNCETRNSTLPTCLRS